MRVFFLTGEWDGLRCFLAGESDEVEGMPSRYLPWLRYKERGYDVHVFVLGDFQERKVVDFHGCKIHLTSRPKLLQRMTRAGLLGRFLAKVRFPVDCILIYRSVASIAERFRPAIVYALETWGVFVAWWLARRYDSTFVKRFYGTFIYSWWFLKRGLSKHLSSLLEFPAWLWPCDLLIVTNDGTSGDRVAGKLGIDKVKFRMWLNGVHKGRVAGGQASRAIRAGMGLSEDHFVLLCLSRLSWWKRQDRAIRALPLILDKVPEARLVIAGDGPRRQYLEGLVAQLGLANWVYFTGVVLYANVVEMMGIGDVFLQTNDLSCLGNTLLEALACGRTIVTWDVGTTRDVITDGVNGCLLPDAEADTIADAVTALARDPAKRQLLARGATEFAEQHLQSWDERLDMEIELTERIYARGHGPNWFSRSCG